MMNVSTVATRLDTVRRLDLTRLRSPGILFPFAALFAALSLTSSAFFTKVNLLNNLDQ
jgi:hypothetical protein